MPESQDKTKASYKYVNTFGPAIRTPVAGLAREEVDPEAIKAYINELLKLSNEALTEVKGKKEPVTT